MSVKATCCVSHLVPIFVTPILPYPTLPLRGYLIIDYIDKIIYKVHMN